MMIIYHVLYEGKNWDICIKLDSDSNKSGFYFRRYNEEFDSVCEFRSIWMTKRQIISEVKLWS